MSDVKVWYHVIAAVVGLCVAALIVWFVFGSASEQGAAQDGSAGALAAADNLCGTIDAADITSTETRALAHDNLPALFDAKGPIPAIADSQPKQQDWVDRVHAASGLCIDEIHIDRSGNNNLVTIDMSTIEGLSTDDAAAYAAAVLAQSFTAPFSPLSVTLDATVDGADRNVYITRRAWLAYQVRRKQLDVPHTMHALVQFKQASGTSLRDQLRITGWK